MKGRTLRDDRFWTSGAISLEREAARLRARAEKLMMIAYASAPACRARDFQVRELQTAAANLANAAETARLMSKDGAR